MNTEKIIAMFDEIDKKMFQLDEALEDNSKTQSVGAKLNVIQGNVRKEKFNTTEILRTIK